MSEKTNVPQKEPFVGPRAFQRGEKIYGRDAEILALKNSLLSGHVMLLHALSGAGKTSLIQAGLAPALEPIGFSTLPLARVNLPLDPQLAEAFPHPPNRYRMSLLISLEVELEKQKIIPASQRVPLKKLAGLSLVKYLELRSPPQTPSSPAPAGAPTKIQKAPWRLLLVLDQFEELITLNPAFRYRPFGKGAEEGGGVASGGLSGSGSSWSRVSGRDTLPSRRVVRATPALLRQVDGRIDGTPSTGQIDGPPPSGHVDGPADIRPRKRPARRFRIGVATSFAG